MLVQLLLLFPQMPDCSYLASMFESEQTSTNRLPRHGCEAPVSPPCKRCQQVAAGLLRSLPWPPMPAAALPATALPAAALPAAALPAAALPATSDHIINVLQDKLCCVQQADSRSSNTSSNHGLECKQLEAVISVFRQTAVSRLAGSRSSVY
jgi:hypothetical protein